MMEKENEAIEKIKMERRELIMRLQWSGLPEEYR
jgi:hypothetical protein